MRLRSLTKHIREQNWFAVFLDFFIVVVGILIAFQITNWNEAQRDKDAARKYKARLITDVELSIQRNRLQISYGQQEVRQLDLVLAALDNCRLSEEDTPIFAAGLYNMGKFDLPIMVMGTIDELNATGNFPLIGSPQLRRSVSETVREFHTKLAIDPQISGRTIPSINYVRSRVRFLLDVHQPPSKSIDPDKVFYDFEALCTDVMFVHAVTTVREMTLANIGLNDDLADKQAELLEKLRGDD
ncbi:MAG: hypothetical protein AAGK67_17205 [Pseudomonadota bacterium]